MTTNIVKWWKTRFWNGYKQFTVLMPGDSSCSESGGGGRGAVSDTEELLPASHPSPQSAPPRPPPNISTAPCSCHQQNCCSPPPPSQVAPSPVPPRRELKFEEFECDVAVQEEEKGGTSESRATPRQEFSFTLYDLDGHGKITKDDIAGLVTTIYETLGATIQVPNTGSKTIRVRLTVAPEKGENSSSSAALPPTPHTTPAKESPSLAHHSPLSPSRLASNAEQLYSRLTNESVHFCKTSLRECNSESCSPYKTKVESSSNKIYSELPLRKESPLKAPRPSVCVNSPRSSGRKLASHGASPARGRRRNTTAGTMAAPARDNGEEVGRERAYSGTLQRQELLNIIQSNMEKNLHALHLTPTPKHRKRGEEGHRHHNSNSAAPRRTKSSRLPSSSPRRPHPTTRTSVDPANRVVSCSHYYLDLAGVECPTTTSLHGLKHRTRELDHARAMAQVVEWLQGAGGPAPLLEQGGGGDKGGDGVAEEEEGVEGEEEGLPRTHRHIHEHVHHHYHHYTDAQLLL